MIEQIIKLAIYSVAIKGETPLSVMLMAKAESGKTEILKKFAFIKSVKYTTEFNTNIFIDFAMEFQAGNKKTIMIPDFLRVTKRKYSTQANSLTIINAITEEGWSGKLPLGQTIDKPINANLITAITKDEINDKRHKWAQIGFMSRFLPITFSYNNDTKQLIRSYIKDRVYHTDIALDFEIPKEKVDIALPKKFANDIEEISKIVLSNLEDDNLCGFRLQRQLQVLAMSSALSNQRNIVSEGDIEVVREVVKFINFKFEEI
jgi:hypothetical protein